MEDNGYLVGVLAGISCFIAGTRLIRLSWRSQKSPELLLGLSLLLWGLSYLCWQIPIATADQPLTQQPWSIAFDRASSALDITGVALVLIICFPPRFYQRWITGASPAPEPEEA